MNSNNLSSIGYGKDRYIRINSFRDTIATLGIVVDVTDEVLIHDAIIYERDYDMLSEVYNRRAFMRKSGQLFSKPEKLQVACLL